MFHPWTNHDSIYKNRIKTKEDLGWKLAGSWSEVDQNRRGTGNYPVFSVF
jgi:hypothetical protein